MSSYGKMMLLASLQQRKIRTRSPLQNQLKIAKPTHTYARWDNKVEKWLASCPDDVSIVSTERVLPSVQSDAASVPFPKLSHLQPCNVDAEEDGGIDGNDSLDSESDENNLKPELDDESNDLSDVVSNLNCEESETSSLKSNRDLFVSKARLRTESDGYVLNKKQYCTFCNKGHLNLARHIAQIHKSERDVAIMLSYKESGQNKQYQKTLTRLRCEGNFKHNIKVLKEGGTDIVVVKRPTKQRKVSEFLPCPHCCGFYCKAELWRHAKKCDLRDSNLETSEISVTRQSMLLLESARLPSEIGASESMRELMAAMRQDDPTHKAVKDELLCQFGEALLQKYGPAKKNDVAQRMRQLARLLITIQDMKKFKEIETTNFSFHDLISGKNFDLCVEGTSILCGLVITPDRRREYERPSLALRLGHLLKKLAIIKRGLCLRRDETDQAKEAKTFEKLLHDEWTDKVSTNALNTLKRRRDQTIEQLPETEDLLQLKTHQEEVRKKAIIDLETSPNYNTWRMLAQNVLARLIIFNKRRAGEVAKLTITTYKNRPNWKRAGHSAITATLEPLEKRLLEKTDLVMVPGKRSRKVPILLPQDVLQAMELLMNTREQVGIPSGNAYFFSSRSSNGFLDGWQAINASSSEAGLKKPELVTSTKCRKYNATITQLFDLGPTEVELLANHMGHSVNIHKEHYRLQESTIEITKVGKLLLAVDTGENLKQSSSSRKANGSGQISANLNETTEDFADLSSEKPSVKITRKISTSSSEDPGTQTANVCRRFPINITEPGEDITELPAEKQSTGNTNKSQEHSRIEKDSIGGKKSAKSRHRWTTDQEYALKTCFKAHLAQKVYPSGLQIKTRKAKYPLLASKLVSQIKSKLQYLMKQ